MMSVNTASRQVVNDMGSLRGLRNSAQQDEGKALKEATKAFEGLFLQMILKEARATKWHEGFAEGAAGTAGAMDKYSEWRDDQLAQDLSAKGSMGIADMLLKQLTPKHGKSSVSTGFVTNDIATDGAIVGKGLDRVYMPEPSTIAGFGNLSKVGMGSHKSMSLPVPAKLDGLDKVSSDTGVTMPTVADTIMLRNLLLGRKN